MLRINLLPVRQLKKRAKAKKQLIGMVFLLLLTGGLLAVVGVQQAQTISALQADNRSLQTEIQSYDSTLKKIEKLKADKTELERKTGIIAKLKTDSSLTVRILDEVAGRVDNQRMWLESLNQQSGSLELTGIALDNQTIATFMDKLKESPFIVDVDLTNSSLQVVSGRNLKNFSLRCRIGTPTAQADTEDNTSQG